MAAKAPRLILVIPCFNEEETLPVTAPLFAGNLAELVASGRVSGESRMAGGGHSPFLKMLGFAVDGITSLSVRPIRLITLFGAVVSALTFVMAVWSLAAWLRGNVVPGWTSQILCVCFLGGIQLLSLGVIGEYVGKIYLEAKGRPRVIISDRTFSR